MTILISTILICVSTPSPASTNKVTLSQDVFDEFGQEVMCSECQGGVSEPPDEIVLCDCCNTGYHQSCHRPPITDAVLSDDGDWYCHNCNAIQG